MFVQSEQITCFPSFTIDSVSMIYSGVYAVSCADVRSRELMFLSESVIYILAHDDRYYVREAKGSVRSGKFIILQCSFYAQYLLTSRVYDRAFYARSSVVNADCGTRA